MAQILFVFPPFYGHVNPSFRVASVLRERGHDIKYLTFGEEIVEHIQQQGFDAVNIPRPCYRQVKRSSLPVVGKCINFLGSSGKKL
jgi:UDP:flavonoid glycosyltransferase YjiC (YdhE family)